MDYDKLIETLRQHGVSCVRAYGKYCSICDEAATALSTLQAENEKLRVGLKQVKRERDAAVKVVERVRSCKDCGHYTGEWTPPCKECQNSEEHHPYFKWRSQKED